MKCSIPSSVISNEVQFLRHAGYAFHIERATGKESWVRLITGNDYPRFHAYVGVRGGTLTIDLHLDQRKPVYKAVKGVHAHAGEYDGPLVEEEIGRLKALAQVVSHSRIFDVPETPGIQPLKKTRTRAYYAQQQIRAFQKRFSV
jgi:hypothetical protein